MNPTNIIDTLKLWNPWERKLETGVRRPLYIERITPFLERKEILVLKGVRRSGKSTIMKQLMQWLIDTGIEKTQILYINFEEYAFTGATNEFLEQALTAYKTHTGNKKKTYIFLDEIQNVPAWERWVRTYYDREQDTKFIITGSNASLLSKELSTLLTGRNITFMIRPFSFAEIYAFKPHYLLETYLQYGGFPEVVLETNQEKKLVFLRQYFEDIIYKDVIDRYHVKDTKTLLTLAQYLAANPGTKISASKLGNVFGIGKNTIRTYINYFIETYLFYEVTYFSYSAKIRHDITKLPKLYIADNGFMTAMNATMKNTSKQFENAVLIKLLEKETTISYWSSAETEVDFITKDTAINVTATNNIPEREHKGLEAFTKKHKTHKKIIITPSTNKEHIIPLEQFLQSKD